MSEKAELLHLLQCGCHPHFTYASFTTFDRHYDSQRHRFYETKKEKKELQVTVGLLEKKILRLQNQNHENVEKHDNTLREWKTIIRQLTDENQNYKAKLEGLQITVADLHQKLSDAKTVHQVLKERLDQSVLREHQLEMTVSDLYQMLSDATTVHTLLKERLDQSFLREHQLLFAPCIQELRATTINHRHRGTACTLL
jgi:chromosome segregation ATPase